MTVDLSGKVAVVTGSAAGIGRAYALGLAGSGAAVVVADIDETGAKETVGLIEAAGGAACAVGVDVSSKESTLALAAAVRERHGTAHVLVNNAAIFHDLKKYPQLTIDIEYWRKVFSVNLDGALLATQALAPLMIEAGWGRVVVQTSTAAYISAGVYGATKIALLPLIRGFAKELGAHNITVNGIAPGATETPAMLDTVPAERLAELRASQYIPRAGVTDDLVGPLLFLCSDAASWITGQTLVVDGGSTWRL
ncbi:2-hydroxycyclohexanecarboxyl-CoA dehydrogenase [Pseudonocardia sp. CNS-139]|nr:2-hydroxycyclohexanecarboxyl-CoA dehydrogenase [Pseudonocardia sp. CNS-139]